MLKKGGGQIRDGFVSCVTDPAARRSLSVFGVRQAVVTPAGCAKWYEIGAAVIPIGRRPDWFVLKEQDSGGDQQWGDC